MPDYPYVPLVRRFINIDSVDPEDDPSAAMLLAMRDERQGLGWDDLLELDAAIILGSAGSGKSREVLAQAQKLRSDGTNSFVLRLEALCRQPVLSSFHPNDDGGRRSYDKWQKTGGEAVVFLDALDEARLPDARNSSALGDALSQLSEDVGRLGRSLRIVLTTRGSEWQGSSDFDLVRDTLRGLRPRVTESDASAPQPKVKVFRLAKLDTGDIKALAQSRQVDPDNFVSCINSARAANLATQPLEVHFLLDLWLAETAAGKDPQQVFSSRHRIYEEVASSRLRAEVAQERRSNLDPIQARRGCEKLAAASVISGIPDLASEAGNPDTLYALNVLATDTERWTDADVRQLLVSSIFQPSVAGRIRFAHRELKDFLAACHFDRAVQTNAGSTEVVSPLLATGLGPDEIPQSTEQVFGWLAAINPAIRKLVVELRPALLIETGDPTSLSSSEKAEALRSQAALYADRSSRGEWFSHDDIRAFATPDLSSAIRELLASTHSPELREFLIEIARFGEIRDLAHELSLIASDQAEALRVRSEACFALADFSDETETSSVLQAALAAVPPEEDDTDSAPSWNMYQVAALACTYPAQATVLDAISLLARLRREASNYGSITPLLFEEFVDHIDDDDKSAWLHLLLRFSAGQRATDHRKLPTVIPRYRPLAPAICCIVLEAIESDAPVLSQSVTLDALEFLFAVGEDIGVTRRRTPLKRLAEVLRQQYALKARLIDRRMSLFQPQEGNGTGAIWAIQPLDFERESSAPSIFTAEDVRTYCKRMRTATSDQEIRIAFECARSIASKLNDQTERKEAREVLYGAARKNGTKELRRAYGPLAPFRDFPSRYQQIHRYRIGQKLRKLRQSTHDSYWRARNFLAFARARSRIAAGEKINMLVWAVRKSPNNPGPKVLDELRSEYGRWIADSFARGFQNYWKTNPIEYSERHTYGALVGLTGLGLENHNALSGYSDELAERAFQYGFCNLNGFPGWVEELASTRPELFVDVTVSILRNDIHSPDDRTFASDGFSRIAYSSPTIRNLVAPFLFQELRVMAPPKVEDLEIGLNIVSASPSVDATDLAEYLQSGFEEAATAFDFTKAWIWLRALFRVSAHTAWSCLADKYGDDWTNASAVIFRDFIGRDTRSFSRAEDATEERDSLAESPDILARLIKATYLAWPPENDPHHEDAYSPGPKDRATERRRHYLNALARQGSLEALVALDGLASDPKLAQHRDAFLYQKDQMIRSTSRRPQYGVDETISFLNTYSKAPTSVSEFRQLVKRHLEALLDRLHHSDDDEGFLYRDGRATEDDLRNWLSGRLYDVGNRYYTIIREQEVATENRPDLRIHARKRELGRISIEIKLIDKDWPGDVIVEKIDTQLAQQYMHEDESHTGFYLLANAAKPKKKETDKKTGRVIRKAFKKIVAGNSVDFAGLIEAVEARATAVTAALGGGKVVEVISVDLSEK